MRDGKHNDSTHVDNWRMGGWQFDASALHVEVPLATMDPAAHRRRLLRDLRRHRSEAGLTQRDVAQELDWSPSKVVRIETGVVNVSTTDLQALLRLYKVSDDVMKALVETARQSKRQSWAKYRDVISQQIVEYFGYEASASIIRQFEPLLIPGLLQIEGYTRAILQQTYEYDVVKIERLAEARNERQELLDRENPPQMFFVVDEAAIRREVASAAVMAKQREHLVDLASRKNISIQVVPFSRGAYSGLRGPIVHLEFPDPDDVTVLYIERGDEILLVDDPDETARYLDAFWDLERHPETRALAEFLKDQ